MPSSKSAKTPSPSLPEPIWHWSFPAIGTQWWIGLYKMPTISTAELQQQIMRLIDEFDDTYSRFRAGSLVSRMAEKAGTYALPANAALLLTFYTQLYTATNGAVTPLVGQLLSDAGYDANYSLKAKQRLQAVPKWDAAMEFKVDKLTLHQPALLDFGAAGKGYLVDLVSQLLVEQGVTQFCVDAGGDMYCTGMPAPLKVGLENPDDISEAIGVANLHNQALCGSAPNRRAWGVYHHIMNPTTLASTQGLKATWVTASSAMLADGLATALFFVEPEALKAQFSFEYALVYADSSLRYSPDFPAEFFSQGNV